jgi:HAD superfamily hydrolase (TIGR01450 family)
MARRLVQAGHSVVVWNRSPEKASPLLELGAAAAMTPADAARLADVLITMVADPLALRAVTEGPDGVAAGAGAALTMVEMSTVGPAAIARLASVLPTGTALIDAPVLGSLAEADSGSLVILVGGPARLVERVEPVLSALGSPIPIGGLGTGAAAKLVANATFFGTLGLLGEAIALAEGLGVSRDQTYRVLAATPLANQAERRRAAIETGEYPPRFPLHLACKDACLIDEIATGCGVDLRLTSATATWLAEADAANLGDFDYTAVLETIVGSSGIKPSRASSVTSHRAPGGGSVVCDGLIVDLDGVVWRVGEPIPGAAEAVAAVRRSGIRVLFLTNEVRNRRAAIAARLTELGIPATIDDVMTSAAATARVVGSLEGLLSRRALVVGPPALHDEIEEAGFVLMSTEEAEQAEVVVVGGHEGFDYGELRAAALAIRNGAGLFATGRDPVFPTPSGLWPGTGALLAAVETAAGVSAVVIGKPEPIVFDMAREALAGCRQVAAIGDHLIADVAGAKRAGLGAILVLSGATRPDDIERATIPPDLVLESLASLPDALGIMA